MSGPEQVQGGGVWSCSCFHLLSAGVSLLALSFFGFRPIANRRGTLKKNKVEGDTLLASASASVSLVSVFLFLCCWPTCFGCLSVSVASPLVVFTGSWLSLVNKAKHAPCFVSNASFGGSLGGGGVPPARNDRRRR